MTIIDIRDEIFKNYANSIKSLDNEKVNIENIRDYYRYRDLLFSELNNDDRLDKMHEEMKCLFNMDDVLKITEQLKVKNNLIYNKLIGLLDKEKSKIIKQKLLRKFILIAPIYYEIDVELNSFNFKGNNVEIMKYDQVREYINKLPLDKDSDINTKLLTYFKFLKCEIEARDSAFAAKKFQENIFIFVYLISYLINVGHEVFHFGGSGKVPLSKSKLSYLFIFENNSLIDTIKYVDTNIKKLEYQFIPINSTKLKEYITLYSSANEEIKHIIDEILSSYYTGLTESNLDFSFLSFWTTTEKIFKLSLDLRQSEIVQIIKNIMKLNEIEYYGLQRICKLRNQLIHRGDINKVSQTDRNLIKYFADFSIKFFIEKMSKYPKDSIINFYELLQKNAVELKKEKKYIDIVLREVLNEKNI